MNNYKINISIFISLLVLAFGAYWYIAFQNKPIVHNAITIQSCSDISPRMVDVVKGEEITFINNDKSDHRFSIGNDSINVPAGKNLAIAADFQYGPGTYSLDCDQIPNTLQISVLSQSVVQPTQGTVSQSFQKTYDDAPLSLRDCLKASLSQEFDKAYADISYNISNAAIGRMSKCSAKPTEEDVTFKEYYNAQGKQLQDCLKSGLGDEFAALMDDTKHDLNTEHRKNMVACLNRS